MGLSDTILKLLPLEKLADFAVHLLWPLAPGWLSEFVGAVIALVKTLVEELRSEEYRELEGKAKLVHVVQVVTEELDDNFDDVPAWNLLPEEARDRILAGIAEFVLFIGRASEEDEAAEAPQPPLDPTRAVKKLRRRARRRR